MSDRTNRNVELARRYHEATKHSAVSAMHNAHYLDFDNVPDFFKRYRGGLHKIKLTENFPQNPVSVFDALSREREFPETTSQAFTLTELAKLLYYTGGITRVKYYGKEAYYFRAAACAGGLYPVEVYVACADMEELSAGLYHFQPLEFSLVRLREGDFRKVIARAACEPSFEQSSAIFIFTGIPWRTTWKYQARGYRHCYWDSGMMAANLLAAASAEKIPAHLASGFVDGKINRLVDVNGHSEFSVCLVSLGRDEKQTAASIYDVPELHLETKPLSPSEGEYRDVAVMHEASCLVNESEMEQWRTGKLIPLNLPQAREEEKEEIKKVSLSRDFSLLSCDTVEGTIKRRTSTRRFREFTFSLPQFSAVLFHGTRGIVSDFARDHEKNAASSLIDIYAIVHSVESLSPGAYFYDAEKHALHLLKQGDFRNHAAGLCLGQPLGGAGCATLFLMADLEKILSCYGNRGYRLAQFEAGIIAGKFYLAAYAQHLGCTGLTFYDDDVTNFFSPHTLGKSCMLVAALGKSAPLASLQDT